MDHDITYRQDNANTWRILYRGEAVGVLLRHYSPGISHPAWIVHLDDDSRGPRRTEDESQVPALVDELVSSHWAVTGDFRHAL